MSEETQKVKIVEEKLSLRELSKRAQGLALLKQIGFKTGARGARLSFSVFKISSKISELSKGIVEYDDSVIESLNGKKLPNGQVNFENDDKVPAAKRIEEYNQKMDEYLDKNHDTLEFPEIHFDDLDEKVSQYPFNQIFDYYPIKD